MALLDIDPADNKMSMYSQELNSHWNNMKHIIKDLETVKGHFQTKINVTFPNDPDLTEEDRSALLSRATRMRTRIVDNLNNQLGN